MPQSFPSRECVAAGSETNRYSAAAWRWHIAQRWWRVRWRGSWRSQALFSMLARSGGGPLLQVSAILILFFLSRALSVMQMPRFFFFFFTREVAWRGEGGGTAR